MRSSSYFDFNKEYNERDLKFEVGDHVRTSKYKNNFAKDYVVNWCVEVFVIKKVRNIVPWKYVVLVIRVEEAIKRKAKKLSVKKKDSDDFFKSWIDKKDIAI